MTQRQLAATVGTLTPTLVLIERYDRPVPTAWVGALSARGFNVDDAADHVTGAWLRAERDRLGLAAADLAARLNTPVHRLIAGERFAHKIPQEWFPVLKGLGFGFPSLKGASPQAEPIDLAVVPESQPDRASGPVLQLPAAAEASSVPGGTLPQSPAVEPSSAASERCHDAALSPPSAPALAPAVLAIVQAETELSRALGLSPLLAIARLAADLHAADPTLPAAQACEAIGVLCEALTSPAPDHS
ncbi:hypothetical protein [Haliangium sp. UPWRP_2]|uniref:hypothetical protein n=1 Tax=Haliangium sp. UPWRP_2 TaxID=1931276 RepID=UPI000B53CDAE|nr:hypothetical protein [Haliangium sp. UPWRP_2]PSM31682.1 hypothetical protein BVG81_004075 [Haliangium sp. UPWRP_2]